MTNQSDINFSSFMPWTNTQVRNNPFPLERYSVFNALSDAQEYAQSGAVAYEGQVIAVTDAGRQKAYVLDHTMPDGLRELADMTSLSSKQDILVATVQEWRAYPNFKPNKGQIVIWSDKSTILSTWEEDGQNASADVDIPGIKIGNGNAYNLDLPFVGDDIAFQLMQHIESNMHVTAQERASWNHKITVGDVNSPADNGVVDETLIITRN